MSITSIAHDFGSKTTSSTEFLHTSESLHYAVTHICLPAKLPKKSDSTPEKDLSLVRAVCAAAHAYNTHVYGTPESQWSRITRMLDNLQASVQPGYLDRDHVISQLRGMRTGDILAFLIRPQNYAIILTKREDCLLFESFEVSRSSDATHEAAESLICSYPEYAVEMPNELLDGGNFTFELANLLTHPDTVDSDLPLPPSAPPTHAQYMAGLLSGILHGVGRASDAPRFVKRVLDDVPRSGDRPAESTWRRSSLWFFIRLAIQMSLDRSPLGRASYKEFILFFICTIAKDANFALLSTHLLNSITSKITRRLKKLGLSIPDWLSRLVLETCSSVREILDARWMQLGARSSPFRNPSRDELIRDTQLSLENSREYIRDALANHPRELIDTPFHPTHRRRGTIDDFLSSNGTFFDEAYDADPEVTLYDVEKSVEQGIDDWVASVTDVDKACTQLEILMDKYMKSTTDDDTKITIDNHTKITTRYGYPENRSIKLLTGIELFVALDKLVVEKVPLLADYCPEIPLVWLERLLLRRTTSLHRLACAYQYLSARYSQSCSKRSVLSNEFTEDSFPVRYYDQSAYHQQLKCRIEDDATGNHDEDQQHPSTQRYATDAQVLQSPLPNLSFHAKVVVFELQCPACIRIWRSVVARVWRYACHSDLVDGEDGGEAEDILLSRASTLQRYFVDRDGSPLDVQIHFACFYPRASQSQKSLPLRYAIRYPNYYHNKREYLLSMWPPRHYDDDQTSCSLFSYSPGFSERYVQGTSHTSNDVLATQADCPINLSLDEFIAYGQLRSGGSLQWANILRGLRSRTLNLRHDYFHFLLAQVVFQVGPLDLSSGIWIWHQDLNELTFCNALLDELENLFMEVGAGSIDRVMTGTISLLLTRVLASSPSEGVSERVITLLPKVRRKTFNWVQELLYNLIMEPTSDERCVLLREMAITCRGTFDVDSAALSKLCHSAEDVDALLSCALFVHALPSSHTVLYERDRRLSLTLEGTLRDVILADVSNYGIDFAVAKTFTFHKPGPYRWEQLQNLDSHWLTCNIKSTRGEASQKAHLNLLNGELRADGQPLEILLCTIASDFIYRYIFRDQGFFIIPSNLPGMDFTTLTMTSKHKVHWARRGGNLVVRAQCNESKDILELIPSEKLKEDLSQVLIDDCVHWLNLSTRIIEIRPLERLWEQSPDNWRIDCASGKYRAYKGHETLVDVRSPTCAMISKCFECLNNIGQKQSNNLLANMSIVKHVQSPPMLQLSVTLPRYELSFFVNAQGELESGDFKAMVYDENQCIGALPGLENVLVLRQKLHLAEGLISRRVLIPRGFLRRYVDHQFQVVRDRRRYTTCIQPLYHSYNVDIELGCLVGNHSLTSTAYLAHLHATTSCDWPDPLTGITGARAALYLFQSAECRSIMKLKALDISGVWTSSRYPEIKSVLEELELRYYWDRNPDHFRSVSELLESRVAMRTDAYQSWLPAESLTMAEDSASDESGHFSTRLPEEPALPVPQVTLDQLIFDRPAPELPLCKTLFHDGDKTCSNDISGLDQLFPHLPMNKSNPPFQQEYVALLEKSAQCFREDSHVAYRLTRGDQIETLEKHYAECRINYLRALDTMKQRLGPTNDPYEQALYRCGQWPPVTADILLRYLASTSPFKFRREWRQCFISLALLLLSLQRARRLFLLALDGLEEELSKELANKGLCDGWDPEEFPDWLLIQVQGNFLIRRAQAETAMEMMNPRSGENTVMQVNMGEGKSSVIIPIVAAALADGKQLVRIIVPKALTVQMFDLLVSRLGGLSNRPIYYLPFSRSPEYKYGKVISLQSNDLHKLMSRCMAERGILLIRPEHVVSLKLMSVEEQIRKGEHVADSLPKLQGSIYKYITTALLRKQLSKDSLVDNMFRSMSRPPEKDVAQADGDEKCGKNGLGSGFTWFDLQKWIHSHVRDILDESDEVLRPRFQLIYTMGRRHCMDGYPDRWVVVQQVLRLVKECADTLSINHPRSMEYKRGPPGSFPQVRIVRSSDVGQRLIPLIVEYVMAGQLPSINVQDISDRALQCAIRSFISDKDALQVPDIVKMVEEYTKRSDQSCTWSSLLLLRGLLTSNILLFALTERRWRVDYGLDSYSRSMLAVPYRAKDVPASNTQFGHSDITIILTCLSYYYGGLSQEQLRAAFEILLDEDDPTTEYALWVKDYNEGSTLPDSLRTLGEINLKSSEQWDKVVFPLFSRNQAAIDFYLSRVVFPKEAKEYPLKLSTSSWDLAEKREKHITGFSGTNDGRWLLPMSIAQRNLHHQQGTNARVIAYLLRPENNFYMTINQGGERCTTPDFLQMIAVQRPEIRILLDVGAQILDFSNDVVAEAWLSVDRDAAGAVYFDTNDELMVLGRNGTCVPAASSPLSQRLHHCVVYLDHAHTRGTDIKLPIGSRAAVTLGPKLTKDSLVQGCMRMRKLGHGHSVMFFAPAEVPDWSIRAVACKKDPDVGVTTVDILCWAIHETWADIQQQAPHWAQQGMDHKSRHDAWSRYCNNDLTPEGLSDAWLQPELKSLEDLYAPSKTKNAPSNLSELDPGIRQCCKSLGVLSLPGKQMEEEQEREVNREKQREREEELPPKAKPTEHSLRQEVVEFVKTGVIHPLHSGSAFRPVFTTLEKSSAATLEGDVWSPFILATADYCNTIEPGSTHGTIDQYLRPVQWVLSSKRDCRQLLVLLSPFEADRLMPDIRASEYVHLHVYAPRTSERMKPSDDLKLYSIPPLPSNWTPPWDLIDQLNVFAGQLYLRDYSSYLRLCHFLGVPTSEFPKDDPAVRRNLFDIPGSFEENEIMFSGSPLSSVMALLAIRTRGRPFAHTHMGKILYGRTLTMKDFERTRSITSHHITTACNKEISCKVVSEPIPPSPSMECDPQSDLMPSGLLPSSKRSLETAGISSAGSKLPQKRLRSN